jgi:hypothetical protein
VVRRHLSALTLAGEPVGRVDIYHAGRRIASAPALSATPLEAPEARANAVGLALAELLDGAFQIASWLGASSP